jgi:hypothetical protein
MGLGIWNLYSAVLCESATFCISLALWKSVEVGKTATGASNFSLELEAEGDRRQESSAKTAHTISNETLTQVGCKTDSKSDHQDSDLQVHLTLGGVQDGRVDTDVTQEGAKSVHNEWNVL